MAKVRVEWVRLARPAFDRGAAVNDLASVGSAQTLVVGGASVQTSAASPFPNPDGSTSADGFARVSVLAGAVNIAWGASPTASETVGARLEAGGRMLIALSAGQRLAFIEAADPAATQDVQTHPVLADAVNWSGAITAGGTAQDLAPANAARKGWRVQNQSTGNLWVRSKGSAGTTVASMDNASLLIPSGATWTEDGHISGFGLSIVGATTAQAFYAREW